MQMLTACTCGIGEQLLDVGVRAFDLVRRRLRLRARLVDVRDGDDARQVAIGAAAVGEQVAVRDVARADDANAETICHAGRLSVCCGSAAAPERLSAFTPPALP